MLSEFREAYLDRAKIGERAAYIEAIRALGGVLLFLEEPLSLSDADPAYLWFMDMTTNLEDLDAGVVPPVFRCPVGSKGLSTVEWMRRVWVVTATRGAQFLPINFMRRRKKKFCRGVQNLGRVA
jgi:hypothetical protein